LEPVTPYKRKGKIIKGCWQLNFYFELPDGTMFRKREKCRLSSKSAANDQWKKREVELYKELTKPKEEQVLIGPKLSEYWPVYVLHCKGERQKPATLDNKRWYWNRWLKKLGDLHLSEITNAKISELRTAMIERSASTVNNVVYALTGCLECALAHKLIATMPFKVERLPRKKKARGFFEPAQLDALLQHATKEERVMILLGSHGGLRAGEMCGLNKADVNLAEDFLTVRRTVRRKVVGTPKNGNEREVALSETLKAELTSYMAAHPEGERVLAGTTVAMLGRWLRACCKRAGLPPTSHTHLFRHSFVTNLGAAGGAPRVIMDQAGHQGLDVTLGYMHMHRNAARATVRLLDGFGSRSAADATPLVTH
jgi:integrase